MRTARITLGLAPAVLVALGVTAGALHETGCVYTFADPSTVIFVPHRADALDIPGGDGLYLEERGDPFGTGFPVPLGSWLFGPDDNGDGLPEAFEGEGSWIYEETGNLPNLQRRTNCGITGFGCEWFPPGCDQNWTVDDFVNNQTLPWTAPCLLMDEDPIQDESCGHGHDIWVWGFSSE